MENKKLPATVEDRLEEYKVIYPDTTVTSVSCSDDESISWKDGLELSKMVCQMTHSGLLQFWVHGSRMYIYKSREFLEVARSFKKGARVRYHDPEHSSINYEAYISKDGINYKDGFAMVNLHDCVDPIDWGEVMAIYCRPVEEDKK